MTTETLTRKSLTARDRCDRCSAQAYVLVQDPSTGFDLAFCGHHFSPKTEQVFQSRKWDILHDARETLNAR